MTVSTNFLEEFLNMPRPESYPTFPGHAGAGKAVFVQFNVDGGDLFPPDCNIVAVDDDVDSDMPLNIALEFEGGVYWHYDSDGELLGSLRQCSDEWFVEDGDGDLVDTISDFSATAFAEAVRTLENLCWVAVEDGLAVAS